MSQDFSELTKRILKFRSEREWGKFHNPKDTAISLVLEATEYLEHFQWKNTNEIEAHIAQHKDKVSDELSDVLYWVLLIAHDLDIDLNESLSKKMDENERKYPIEKAKGKHTKYTEL